MNYYFHNLHRIEFTVTLACTGRCKHCQNGFQDNSSGHIDGQVVSAALRDVCALYSIDTVMTFGGEPLLVPDTVCMIQNTAAEFGVKRRQVITNGYFSEQQDRIEEVVRSLADCGVNDLLLSVDAFHEETIPIDTVLYFAERSVLCGLNIKLNPAWLVSPEDDNIYNVKTREIIKYFEPLHIETGAGNVIFPCGNALIYLSKFLDDVNTSSPYEEDPRDIRSLSFSPNGDVLNGNIYKNSIQTIMENYRP